MPGILLAMLFCSSLVARTPEWEQAHDLYQRTEYQRSLAVLLPLHQRDAATLELIGQNYFMLAEYKKATGFSGRAVALGPIIPSRCCGWAARSAAARKPAARSPRRATRPRLARC